MAATLTDRVLLLLSIKEPGKKIGLDHIFEKISRDMKGAISKNALEAEIEKLDSEGLLTTSSEECIYITDSGFQMLKSRLPEIGDDLNLSYRRVLRAKEYYPQVAECIIPFLANRPVSVVKVFSDERDPINSVKPLFVRYAKYKPSPVFIRIESADELKRYVDDHAVDYVPYVHSFDMKAPSWLVVDLDAGEDLKDTKEGFAAVKLVAGVMVELLHECSVGAAVKFSGSRGMQIWSSLDNDVISRIMGKGDLFQAYRTVIQKLQEAADKRIKESNVGGELGSLAGKGMTTSSVAKKGVRSEKVLVDWSSMKPYGDVRAPFSMHYKTGMISCPVEPLRINEFETGQALPDAVAKKAEMLSSYFNLQSCDPTKLLHFLGI